MVKASTVSVPDVFQSNAILYRVLVLVETSCEMVVVPELKLLLKLPAATLVWFNSPASNVQSENWEFSATAEEVQPETESGSG